MYLILVEGDEGQFYLVLILILMEQCIWFDTTDQKWEAESVLILILMEQCIWLVHNGAQSAENEKS